MGLDTYFFKTTKEERNEKILEILDCMQKNFDSGIKVGNTNMRLYICDANDYENKFLKELHPNIYWRKFNQATAWFSEKVFHNPKGTLKVNWGILEVEDLKRFRNDCKKVLDKCEMADGSIKIDKKFCKSIFPDLYKIPFAGNHEYDEEFIHDIKTALSDVDKLLLMSYNSNVEFIFFADY